MKKTFKRLGAALLAMAMAVSVLCTGALAADSPSITIKNASAGHKYEAYQVFAGTLDSTGTKLGITDWGTGVNATELLTELKKADDNTSGESATYTTNPFGNKFVNATTAADVAAVVATFTGENENLVKEFAKVVAAHLSNTVTGTFTEGTADDNGKVTYTNTNVTVGYYLVKDKSDSTNIDAFTDYILKVVGAAEVEPKFSVPKVEKKIVEGDTDKDATTANIGDDVTFKLTATLPTNYGDYSNYELTFHDLLSSGLTLDESSITVVAKSNAEDSQNITLAKNTDYTVKTGTSTSENDSTKCNLEVAINDMKANDQLKNLPAGSTITVTYKAKLNANASIGVPTEDGNFVGNSNKVKLEYSNNPNDTDKKGTTPEDEVRVYAFQIDVDKFVKGSETEKLEGAKFKLYYTDNNSADGDKHYAIVDTDHKLTGWSDTDGTELVTDKDGKVSVIGLKEGTYYLEETEAPAGYNKLTEPVKIVITAAMGTGEQSNVLTGLNATVGTDSTNAAVLNTGIITAGVANDAGSQLPSTGGMGTTLFYIIGGVLMASAAVVLVIKKKRSSAE